MDNRDTVWIELPSITRPPREYLTCMDDRKEALAKAAGMEVGQLQKSLEMQAGLADQANVGGAGGGGAGLDAA